PEMVARLRHHTAFNDAGGMVINAVAVGAESGTLPFFPVRDGNTGASSLAAGVDGGEEIRVPVVTLDGYVERKGIERVDLLKVDVEGAELLVFRGAHRLLSS